MREDMPNAEAALHKFIETELRYDVPWDALATMTVEQMGCYGFKPEQIAACIEKALEITLTGDERNVLPRMSLAALTYILDGRALAANPPAPQPGTYNLTAMEPSGTEMPGAVCVICGGPARRVLVGKPYCEGCNPLSKRNATLPPCARCGAPARSVRFGKDCCDKCKPQSWD